ncbi:hypothetical protein ACH495_09260 [Micromonospora sp. NPDC018662]|uniref:hypothetical protein n=1 Tax=Micromonospora sp. NPDC018662 TaxID=3364238 RepID=UPI0037A0743D
MVSEERIRAAMLVGLTVLAVALGGWWWRSTAPWLGTTVGASADDLARSRVDVDAAVGAAPPEQPTARSRMVVEVDPRTGEVRSPVVVDVEPDGGTRQGDVSHVVWRETSRLSPGGPPVVRQANPSRDDEYRLSVSCAGDGAVSMTVSGAGSDGVERVMGCGGRVNVSLLGGTGAPVLVRFAAVRGEVELDARMEALY